MEIEESQAHIQAKSSTVYSIYVYYIQQPDIGYKLYDTNRNRNSNVLLRVNRSRPSES